MTATSEKSAERNQQKEQRKVAEHGSRTGAGDFQSIGKISEDLGVLGPHPLRAKEQPEHRLDRTGDYAAEIHAATIAPGRVQSTPSCVGLFNFRR
jgi:hypothetical protein